MKLSKVPLLSSLFFCLFFAGCGSVSSVPKPPILQVAHMDQVSPSPASTMLRVIRTDQVSPNPAPLHSWAITDAQAIRQLFDEIQRLPAHHNLGADTCARPHYSYALDFLVGTKSLQQDELYSYCLTLTFADGSEHDPTAPFYSLLTGMLHLSKNELLGW